jgi:hypothetical protein
VACLVVLVTLTPDVWLTSSGRRPRPASAPTASRASNLPLSWASAATTTAAVSVTTFMCGASELHERTALPSRSGSAVACCAAQRSIQLRASSALHKRIKDATDASDASAMPVPSFVSSLEAFCPVLYDAFAQQRNQTMALPRSANKILSDSSSIDCCVSVSVNISVRVSVSHTSEHRMGEFTITNQQQQKKENTV